MELRPGRGGEVDDALSVLREKRRIALTVPSFAIALDVVARTELLGVVPRSLAELDPSRVRATKLPVALAPLSVSMYWHRRVHGDAGVKALRQGLLSLVGPDRRLRA
jgi:DNA-binding transcriptional LysR family regulator